MTLSVSAGRTATVVGAFPRDPAYAGLADALRQAIGDGRIPVDVRLPSERDLTETIGVSRTTVTRAYAALCESGYAEARRGAGTFTRVPGGRRRTLDRALVPGPDDTDVLDLNCAAASAPPGLAAAYTDAVAELPAYLGGHGYFPTGLPRLQAAIARSYDDRGLPTDPAQVLVTPGALSAAAIVAQAFTSPGDRVVVEDPVYPNATSAIRNAGARLIGAVVDPDGWDVAATGALLRQSAARFAYLVPDFQNPTGLVMGATEREEYAAHLARASTLAVVDEAHQALRLDGGDMPPPFAAFARDTVTVGSASKTFWGGLRLGWIRSPPAYVDRLTRARLSLDLGAPVLEQLVLTRLLEEPDEVLAHHRDRLRGRRDALVAAVRRDLPEWEFRLPAGGLALWCRLPEPLAVDVTVEAERLGVIVAAGPVFAVDGGHGRFVRIPWSRPAADLETAVGLLAQAWALVRERRPRGSRGRDRVTVA